MYRHTLKGCRTVSASVIAVLVLASSLTAAEEAPFFRTKDMGSYVHAQSIRNRKHLIEYMVVLEMITDTAFFRNRNYHQSTDTPRTLDYNRMAEVVKGLAASFYKD